MKKHVFAGRLVLILVLVTSVMVWAGCTPAAGAGGAQDGASGSYGGQDDGVRSLSGPGVDSTPEAEDTREPAETPEAESTDDSGDSEKVTGVIEAIEGSIITVNGVQYDVKDASLLSGLNVGDTIMLEVEIEDGGVVVVTIEDEGDDDNSNDNEIDDNGNDNEIDDNNRQIPRSNRSSAQQYLTILASKQEQYLLDARTYTATIATLNAGTAATNRYSFSIDIAGCAPQPCFTITATPTHPSQVADGVLTLNNLGQKTGKWTSGN